MTSGWAACQAGETKRGLALLQDGNRRWEATGAKFNTTRNATQLAEGYILAGMPEVALEHLAAARSPRSVIWRTVYGRRGMSSDGNGAASRTRPLCRRSKRSSKRRLRSLTVSKRGYSSSGPQWVSPASGAIRGARQRQSICSPRCMTWFTEGFALPDLIEAGALLADLGIRSASDPSFQPT